VASLKKFYGKPISHRRKSKDAGALSRTKINNAKARMQAATSIEINLSFAFLFRISPSASEGQIQIDRSRILQRALFSPL
jgi:hypothetical protein